ncbi:MAG: hypothetical protein HY231_10155 [Acidobacteria bacterium]|nr:hypothetical protein [Acidobacteriota bacterium]
MQNYLNLSRQPYTNRRLFWFSLAILFTVGLIFAFWTVNQKADVVAAINSTRQQIESTQTNVKLLQEKKTATVAVAPQTVLTDEQKYQLASARLLIARKSFSWNGLLSDIEKHIPKDVRLLSIKIGEGSKGLATGAIAIELAAAGKTAGQMTEMMADLEKSGGLFRVDQAQQQAPLEGGDVPFSFNLIYQPGGGD